VVEMAQHGRDEDDVEHDITKLGERRRQSVMWMQQGLHHSLPCSVRSSGSVLGCSARTGSLERQG
jgi:hypothetical protein